MTTEQVTIREPVNGEYPFRMLLLSGEPLFTKKLGPFIIDLATLSYHKDHLTVDYNHDENNILGYADKFEVVNGGLFAEGKLISCPFVDRLVELSTHGVALEASPTIAEQEGVAEWLPDGETAIVNDIARWGPLTIFRNVPLRGMSACPYGTDKYTSFTLLKKEFEPMPNDSHEKRTVTTIAPETTKLAAGAAAEPKAAYPDLEELIGIFGEQQGLKLYREGCSIEDARKYKELQEKFDLPTPEEPATTVLSEGAAAGKEPPVAAAADPEKAQEKTALKAELTALKKLLTEQGDQLTRLSAALPRGETEPVSHGIAEEPEKKKPLNSVAGLAAKYKKRGIKAEG